MIDVSKINKKEPTGDVLDATVELNKKHAEILEEQRAIRQEEFDTRKEEVLAAKTQKEKVKLLREFERDVTKQLLEKKATIKDLEQKIGVSRFQARTRERYGVQDGDVPFQKVTKAGEQAKTEAYYDADKQRTIGMALGKEKAPSDLTQNAISMADHITKKLQTNWSNNFTTTRVIFALVFLAIALLFYWFQVSPSQIRKECYWEIMTNESASDFKYHEKEYQACLFKNGITK